MLRRVLVRYTLALPGAVPARVERALASHVDKCPTARTLQAAWRSSGEAVRAGDRLIPPG